MRDHHPFFRLHCFVPFRAPPPHPSAPPQRLGAFKSGHEFTYAEVEELLRVGYAYEDAPGPGQRRFVALSLAEAETLRRVLHCAAEARRPAVPGTPALALALRVLPHGFRPVGQCLGYASAARPLPPRQALAAQQCYRFLNSEIGYSPRELLALLRALQRVPSRERARFWLDVRRCRRRPQTPVAHPAPIAQALYAEDEVCSHVGKVGRFLRVTNASIGGGGGGVSLR